MDRDQMTDMTVGFVLGVSVSFLVVVVVSAVRALIQCE